MDPPEEAPGEAGQHPAGICKNRRGGLDYTERTAAKPSLSLLGSGARAAHDIPPAHLDLDLDNSSGAALVVLAQRD